LQIIFHILNVDTRLGVVIVKNKVARFYGPRCIIEITVLMQPNYTQW